MKVVVTGIGCISGMGKNVEEHLQAFRSGKDGLGKITLFSTKHTVPVSEVKLSNKELKELTGIRQNKTLSRTALLGIAAASEALKDSGVKLNHTLRVGLVSATSTGGMDLSERFYPEFREDNRKGRLRNIISHDAADSTERIAGYLGISGFRTTISTACSSAANAIMLGARLIQQDIVDVVIAGGTDALCQFTLNGFASLMILDREPCKPFDANRAGLNLGEGAGYLVLQSEKVLSRKPYCELAGYANANDAYHQTASSPEGNGAYLAMKEALATASILPEQVDYMNVHGTGTTNNDASESAGIQRIFGTKVPSFSSTKPFTGHTLGAAGGLEAVFSVLSIEYGIIYPNKNFHSPIVETGLIPETTYREGISVKTVLSNSFGFGGNNTSLVFTKVHGEKQDSTTCLPRRKIYINSVAANYQWENSQVSITECQLDKTLISNPTVRRRMNRLLKMGVATGMECLKQIPEDKPDAILTATGLGCLADTEKFINTILDNDEELLTPTAFIHSTFNTVGAQIGLLTQNHCYNNTYVHRTLSLESALLDGKLLLMEQKADHLLVGSMDEMTPLLKTLCNRLDHKKTYGQNLPCEGTAFFFLSTHPKEESYATLEDIKFLNGHFTYLVIEEQIRSFMESNGVTDGVILKPEEYKKQCGDYFTCISFALWDTCIKMRNREIVTPVVLYNHFLENHSFLLLKPVETVC